MWLLLYDPLFIVASIVAYTVGFIVLQFLASKIAPRVASAVSGKLSLYTAMLLAGLLIVGGGLLAIYAVYYAALAAGYRVALELIVIAAAAMSIISYLLSPFMINAAYGAKESPRLQEIVDAVARRAGVKPPKAVVVEGPPNAFAYGNFLSGRFVAVTRSLYELLDREELEAVIGHELGHHRHRDMVVLLLLGLVPSILYYMGVWLLHAGLAGAASSREREGGGGGVVALIGLASIALSFVMQVAVLAFSRLREYYADAHGALVAGARPMQRALAKIHLYYSSRRSDYEYVERSSVKALFIYALVESLAAPFYSGRRRAWRTSWRDIDSIVEALKHEPVDPVQEFLSDHPPIPKRLRFLDALGRERV